MVEFKKVRDKSAICKSLGLMILSVLMIALYGNNLNICGDFVDYTNDAGQINNNNFNNIKQSDCRMTVYTGTSDTGDVYAVYYVVIWIGILGASLLGVCLLLCNCSTILTKIYALVLVAGAAMITVAEVMTMSKNRSDANKVAGATDATKAQPVLLNMVVAVMQLYILLNTAADAFFDEMKRRATMQGGANNMAV